MRERHHQGLPRPPYFYTWRNALHIAALLVVVVVVSGDSFTNQRQSSVRQLEALDASQDGSGGIEETSETTAAFQVIDEAQVEEHGQQVQVGGLPQCYSSAAADPSEGSWQRYQGSQEESPANVGNWSPPRGRFIGLQRCQHTWNVMHPNGESMPFWIWEADNCSLRDVSASKFCHAMEGRKGILLVGDSLTNTFTKTLAFVLRADLVAFNNVKEVWSACEHKLKVTFMRSDHLDSRPSAYVTDKCDDTSNNTAKMCSCALFGGDEILREVDVLVVNSGVHITENSVYGAAMRAVSTSLAASMTRLHGNESILVVRNTLPGHWDCTKRTFDGPVEYDVAASLVAAGPPKYGWNTIRERNVLLEEAFSTEKGWILLDAYSPTILRPDMHIGGHDCLHYCAPGPTSHWVTLLYNIILVATGTNEEE